MAERASVLTNEDRTPSWIHPENLRSFPNLMVTNSCGSAFRTNASLFGIICPTYASVLAEVIEINDEAVVILPDLTEETIRGMELLIHEGNVPMKEHEDPRTLMRNLQHFILPLTHNNFEIVCLGDEERMGNETVELRECELKIKEVITDVLPEGSTEGQKTKEAITDVLDGSKEGQKAPLERGGVLTHKQLLEMFIDNRKRIGDTARAIITELDLLPTDEAWRKKLQEIVDNRKRTGDTARAIITELDLWATDEAWRKKLQEIVEYQVYFYHMKYYKKKLQNENKNKLFANDPLFREIAITRSYIEERRLQFEQDQQTIETQRTTKCSEGQKTKEVITDDLEGSKEGQKPSSEREGVLTHKQVLEMFIDNRKRTGDTGKAIIRELDLWPTDEAWRKKLQHLAGSRVDFYNRKYYKKKLQNKNKNKLFASDPLFREIAITRSYFEEKRLQFEQAQKTIETQRTRKCSCTCHVACSCSCTRRDPVQEVFLQEHPEGHETELNTSTQSHNPSSYFNTSNDEEGQEKNITTSPKRGAQDDEPKMNEHSNPSSMSQNELGCPCGCKVRGALCKFAKEMGMQWEDDLTTCPLCDFTCRTRKSKSWKSYEPLYWHMRNRHVGEMFQCATCGIDIPYTHIGTVQQHMGPHQATFAIKSKAREERTSRTARMKKKDDRIVFCPVCNFAGRSSVLKGHVRSKHKNSSFDCTKCGKKIPAYPLSKVESHIQSHFRSETEMCVACGFIENPTKHRQTYGQDHDELCAYDDCKGVKFTTYEERTQHVKEIHNGVMLIRCGHCRSTFNGMLLLKEHVKTHREYAVTCQICGKGFANSACLNFHMKSHHFPSEDQLLSYPCHLCGKVLSKLKMEFHIQICGKRHKCEHCEKEFTNRLSLKSHTLTYHVPMDQRPFPCNVCGKRFGKFTRLRYHLAIHENKREHKCSVCGLGFNESSNKIQHERRVHKIKTNNRMPDSTVG